MNCPQDTSVSSQILTEGFRLTLICEIDFHELSGEVDRPRPGHAYNGPSVLDESIGGGASDSLRGTGDDDVFLHDSAFTLHRFDQSGRRRTLKRESIADLADDPFL